MSDNEWIDIVFDGPPAQEAGRFVEVEDERGMSVCRGQWEERGDGYWVLRMADPETFVRWTMELRAECAALRTRVEQAERERDAAREVHRITLTAACGEIERVGRFLGLQEEPEWNGLPGSVASQLIEGIAAMLDAVAAPLRADRDAWRAKAEARPEISPETAAAWREGDTQAVDVVSRPTRPRTEGGDGMTDVPHGDDCACTQCAYDDGYIDGIRKGSLSSELSSSYAYERGASEGYEDGHREGRRESLWLMAVGATCLYALTDDWEMAALAHEMRCYALGALVDAGDARAMEYM